MYDFLNSSLFNSLVTILVGSFAIGLYLKNKRDNKREAAAVILMEIRQAEKSLESMKSYPLNLDSYTRILPSNNWLTYCHLFTSNLDADELDLIHNFYNDCSEIDRAASELAISHQTKSKNNSIQHILAEIAKDSKTREAFEERKNCFLPLINSDITTLVSHVHTQVIQKCLNKLRYITTSTAGAKLKKIAK